MSNKKSSGPRVLFIDIETAPILAQVWKIWDENISLSQIKQDWHLISFAAKFLGEKEIFYMDQRKSKNIEDDRKLLEAIWKLLDEADIVVGQNSKAFDVKKINARFIMNGFSPPSSFKQIDTLLIAKKYFGFTSNKLEFMTSKLNKKHKKSSHKKFTGFELWKECLNGNQTAWREMEEYNKLDILSLEELYHKLIPWDTSINFDLYTDDVVNTCKCGNTEFKKNGFAYTSSGKFQRFCCTECGAETRSKENLFSKEKKQSLRPGTSR